MPFQMLSVLLRLPSVTNRRRLALKRCVRKGTCTRKYPPAHALSLVAPPPPPPCHAQVFKDGSGSLKHILAAQAALSGLILFCTDSRDMDPLTRAGVPIVRHQMLLLDTNVHSLVINMLSVCAPPIPPPPPARPPAHKSVLESATPRTRSVRLDAPGQQRRQPTPGVVGGGSVAGGSAAAAYGRYAVACLCPPPPSPLPRHGTAPLCHIVYAVRCPRDGLERGEQPQQGGGGVRHGVHTGAACV